MSQFIHKKSEAVCNLLKATEHIPSCLWEGLGLLTPAPGITPHKQMITLENVSYLNTEQEGVI